MDDVLFSSKSGEWETPQELFDILDEEFHFTLDVCASADNAKCKTFYNEKINGLDKPYGDFVCWMNPPYGRGIGAWIEKAYKEAQAGATVVCLVPARTDTRWWWDWATKAHEIRFLKGRLKFGGAPASAPFPSAVLVFESCKCSFGPHTSWWNWKEDEYV